MRIIRTLLFLPLAVLCTLTIRPCLDNFHLILPLSHEEIGRLVYYLCSTDHPGTCMTIEELLFHIFDQNIITPYELLLKCCHSDRYIGVIDYLLKMELVRGDEDCNGPLRVATVMGSVDVVRRLLEEAHIDPTDKLGRGTWNAIDTAIMTFQPKVLDILLEDARTAQLDLDMTLEAFLSVFQDEFARHFGSLDNVDRYQALLVEFERGTVAWKGCIYTFLRVLREPRVQLSAEIRRLVPFQLLPHLDGMRAVKEDDGLRFQKWFVGMAHYQYFNVVLNWVFTAITHGPNPGVWRCLAGIGSRTAVHADRRIPLIYKMYVLFLNSRNLLLPEIHGLIFRNLIEFIRLNKI